jgi:transcriptional accessory protein Tex/SPT6
MKKLRNTVSILNFKNCFIQIAVSSVVGYVESRKRRIYQIGYSKWTKKKCWLIWSKASSKPTMILHRILNRRSEDSYKRLLEPAISNEVLQEFKVKADAKAIEVFAANLSQLLLAPPLGEKRILALDPGYKSGCKLVCLDEQGDLLYNETIYPHPPQNESVLAMKKLRSLVQAYQIEAISIGNGTASRETEMSG